MQDHPCQAVPQHHGTSLLGACLQLNATLYDSDPGPALAERKKISFWKVLKRMLHFPSITKPRSPKAPTPDATATASARRASYFTKRSKRFSFGRPPCPVAGAA